MVWRLFVVILVTSSGLIAMTGSAQAADCQNEYGVFIGNTVDKQYSNGTRNDIVWSDRSLDPGCSSRAGSTAHYTEDTYFYANQKYVEVGWEKGPRCPGINYCFFTEKCSINNPCLVNRYPISQTPDPGTFDLFRIANRDAVNGVTPWYLSVDRDHDGVYTDFNPNFNTSWHHGVAEGESFGWGGDTSLYAHQQSLHFKNNSNDWVAWPNNYCDTDDSAAYGWNRITNTEFEIDLSHAGQQC